MKYSRILNIQNAGQIGCLVGFENQIQMMNTCLEITLGHL